MGHRKFKLHFESVSWHQSKSTTSKTWKVRIFEYFTRILRTRAEYLQLQLLIRMVVVVEIVGLWSRSHLCHCTDALLSAGVHFRQDKVSLISVNTNESAKWVGKHVISVARCCFLWMSLLQLIQRVNTQCGCGRHPTLIVSDQSRGRAVSRPVHRWDRFVWIRAVHLTFYHKMWLLCEAESRIYRS